MNQQDHSFGTWVSDQISRINLHYLTLAAEVARRDPEAARVQLGLSPVAIEELSALSQDQLHKLSENVSLLRPRWDESLWTQQLREAKADEISLETQLLRAAKSAQETRGV